MAHRSWDMSEAEEARRLYETGMTLVQIDARLGYSYGTITTMIRAAGGVIRNNQWEAEFRRRKEAQIAQVRERHYRIEDQAAALYDTPLPVDQADVVNWTFEDIATALGITTNTAIQYVMGGKGLGRCELCGALIPEGEVFCADCREEASADMGELIKASSPTAAALQMWERIGVTTGGSTN